MTPPKTFNGGSRRRCKARNDYQNNFPRKISAKWRIGKRVMSGDVMVFPPEERGKDQIRSSSGSLERVQRLVLSI